jgi:hypothetical protein
MQEQDLRGICEAPLPRPNPISGFICADVSSEGCDWMPHFVCLDAQLIVELDGSQHLDSSSDRVRDEILGRAGFRIIRFWNDDALTRTDLVLAAILAALEAGSVRAPT